MYIDMNDISGGYGGGCGGHGSGGGSCGGRRCGGRRCGSRGYGGRGYGNDMVTLSVSKCPSKLKYSSGPLP